MMRRTWIDLIAAAGVIASLILLSIEIRSNTKAVRAAALESITSQAVQLNLAIATAPELRSGYRKIMAGHHNQLTLDEEDALVAWYSSLMRLDENRFRQRDLGIFGRRLTNSGVAAIGSGTAVRLPFFHLFWETRRAGYPADFRAYVDSTIIPRGVDSVPRLIKR
jgi:hypothetical protein